MIVGITANLQKPEIFPVLRTLLDRVREHHLSVVLERRLARLARRKRILKDVKGIQESSEESLPGSADMILALGGDGTILRLARLIGKSRTPILGINVGKLGFLAEVSIDEIEDCLREIVRGEYEIEDRMMLQASAQGRRLPSLALNDIVVERYGSSRVMKFATFVNDQYVASHTADGVIVSTPTGSTAYSLSNGGPIIHPSSNVIAISPICPHTLTARPLIVRDDAQIVIRVDETPHRIHLTADGQLETLLKTPIRVMVRKSPLSARLVRRLTVKYYDVLRKKLNWGSDVRLSGG